ncbi:MAG: ribbon-helix-helix domain-containing protein [Pseudomonadota bacterium]
MPMQNISATIDSDLLKKLDDISDISERNRSWLIAKAVELYLEEFEDLQIAMGRLNDERLSSARFKKALNA